MLSTGTFVAPVRKTPNIFLTKVLKYFILIRLHHEKIDIFNMIEVMEESRPY